MIDFYRDTITGLEFRLYKPTLFKLFDVSFEKMTMKRRIRFITYCLRSSYIYYMEKQRGETLGYCLLKRGGGRHPMTPKEDYVISPYVVREDQRGKGYGSVLLKTIKMLCEKDGKVVYGYVNKSNTASEKAMQKTRYIFCGEAEIKGLFRKLTPSKSGMFKVFKSV